MPAPIAWNRSPLPENRFAPLPLGAIRLEGTLHEALKAERLRCNMTQEFVAETLGVSRQAVSKWECGAADPSTSNLLALAKLYGVDAKELLERVE